MIPNALQAPVVIPVMGMIVNILALAASQHVLTRLSFMASVAAGFVLGLGTEVGLDLLRLEAIASSGSSEWVVAVANCAIYVCLGYTFFHVTNIGEASIRVRIFREIERANRPVSEEELLRSYSEQTILKIRLERMLRGGIVAKHDGRYVLLSTKLLNLARFFRMLKLLLLRRPSEFQ